MYLPPVKLLRSTEYGSGSVDVDKKECSGAMLAQQPKAAPSGRLCTDVVSSKMADMKYIKPTAYD